MKGTVRSRLPLNRGLLHSDAARHVLVLVAMVAAIVAGSLIVIA
ncbi:hypothetical protein [Microbacterium sp. NIBRBAC000506063]|nr:hypothetical protein [Microbacterium sp. NIBRBAC000506063]